METTSRSQRYTKVVYPRKVALVVGNEITGVDPRYYQSGVFVCMYVYMHVCSMVIWSIMLISYVLYVGLESFIE